MGKQSELDSTGAKLNSQLLEPSANHSHSADANADELLTPNTSNLWEICGDIG